MATEDRDQNEEEHHVSYNTDLDIRLNEMSARLRRQLGSSPAQNRNLPDNLERRYARLDLRASKSGDRKMLSGHAARFNVLSEDLGGFKENLAPGCFSKTLRTRPDVALLNGHDVTQVLARTTNRSLSVSEDSQGLAFEATLPDTTLANDVFEQVRSGLVNSMSFGMFVDDDFWEDGIDDRGARCQIRIVRACTLLEVSCVLWPAYLTSDVSAAARDLFPAGVPLQIRARVRGSDIDLLALRARAEAAVRSL